MTLPFGAKAFVAVVFAGLWLSFLVVPYMLFQEFGGTDWFGIAMFHSYIFIFYPLFGLVALFAFYRPAVVLTDLYWRFKKFGKVRFIVGYAVVVGLSYVISLGLLKLQPRSVWEVAQQLPGSAAAIADCEETGKNCNAGPLLSPMFAVRAASKKRFGLVPFTRDCTPDALMERPADNAIKRHCFMTRTLEDAETCCVAQTAFASRMQVDPLDWGRKSQTGLLHEYTLPFKSFFISMMGIIALMLVFWHDEVVENYRGYKTSIERGLIVGAIAMLMWPLMEYAYGQSAGVMFGNWEPGFNPKVSILVFPWALLIGIFFLRNRGFGVLSQVGSVLGAAVAAFQYDQVTNFSERLVGSGAGINELVCLVVLAVVAIIIVIWPFKMDKEAMAEAAKVSSTSYAQQTRAALAAGRDPLKGGLR